MDLNDSITEVKKKIQKLIEEYRFSEAEKIIAEYKKVLPDDAEIYSLHAVMKFYQGKMDSAEQIVNEGLLLDENNPDLLYNKGYIMESNGKKALSRYYYNQAYRFNRDPELREELEDKLEIPSSANVITRILIAAPVHQDHEILGEFLSSLSRLNTTGLALGYLFIDDNTDTTSSELLQNFCYVHENAAVISSKSGDIYICDDTHHWNENLIQKITSFKNFMIRHAIDENYDFIFFIDSDILLHPNTLKQLISDKKDIVSNIFWTRWQANSVEMPQVWLEDSYSFHKTDRSKKDGEENKTSSTISFFSQLRTPGVYEVGGLGACTLISRNALLAGVSFTKLDNISFWGEDRHFCIRAVALGFKLFVDTHYPALHLYRKQELKKVAHFKHTGEYKKSHKICLVSNSCSGSNTLALYKLMPEEFLDKYDVHIINQLNVTNYILEILDSDVVITNEGNFLLNNKNYKPDQILIDLWHGFPLKAMGLMDKQDKFKNSIEAQWQSLNYMASYSSLFNEAMNKCTNIPIEKFVITGTPRNDFLFSSPGRKNLEILYNCSFENSKLAIFMPTFRYSARGNRTEGSKNRDNIFGFDSFDIQKFNYYLELNNIHMFIKLHPAEEKRFINTLTELTNIHILTDVLIAKNELDLYELLNGFDVLMTDYSSVYFDYLLVDRPEIFTPVDVHEYEQSRGFLFSPYEDWAPGPMALNQEFLEQAIIDQLKCDTYKEKRKIIRDKIHFYQDNMSSKRICQLIDSLVTQKA